VDDGEAAGSSGGARGGLVRRRLLQGFRGGDLAIGLAPVTIEVVNGVRRSGEGWGVSWCAWFGPGNALFIGLSKGCGAGWWSTCSRRLRRASELSEGAAVFYGSWRSERWRQRGRGGPGWVALLPCPSRPRRTRVGFSGDGGHGSWSRACPTASGCRVRAQGARRGSRAWARWLRGACPGRVHGAHGRDASGMPGDFGRAISGEARASMATWPVLGGVGDAVAHGGEVARGGEQGREGEVVGSGDMAGMAMSSLAPPLPRFLFGIKMG
jgi:hypothetical protein